MIGQRNTSTDDGRIAAAHAAAYCYCAQCWGFVVECWDDINKVWVARCASNESHRGFHHITYVERRQQEQVFEYLEAKHFYERSIYAEELGLEAPLTGIALQEKMQCHKRALGRDGTGL